MLVVHTESGDRNLTNALETEAGGPFDLRNNLKQFERGHISNILELAEWDLEDAAEMLGISPQILTKKMKTYNLTRTQGEYL